MQNKDSRDDRTAGTFSVLMAVYAGDDPVHFRDAVRSNTVGQRLRPAQFVLAQDGPVPDALAAVVASIPGMLEGTGIAVDVVRLETNRGLAAALNAGLRACRCDIVARADADDLSLPERYASQIPAFAGDDGTRYDVVGASIQEFGEDGDGAIRRGQVRTLPEGGAELERFARMRSPLHHPAVAFRRDAVIRVGGYPERAGRFEDYLLWARLMMSGAALRNLPEVLVLYRVDAGAYARRGGRGMFAGEMALQRAFLRMGFVSVPQYVRNVLVRAVYRLVPTAPRRWAYRAMTALRGRHRPGVTS